MTQRIAWVTAYKQKADGTLAVLIPRAIRDGMGLAEGDQLAVYEDDGRMVIEPVPERRKGRSSRNSVPVPGSDSSPDLIAVGGSLSEDPSA